MYNSQDIAERIKNTAVQNNCKLGDMFSELGLSVNTLHNMKTSIPKTDTLAKIADYLGVSVDYLLGRENEKIAPTAVGESELFNYLKQTYSTDELKELASLSRDKAVEIVEKAKKLNSK